MSEEVIHIAKRNIMAIWHANASVKLWSLDGCDETLLLGVWDSTPEVRVRLENRARLNSLGYMALGISSLTG